MWETVSNGCLQLIREQTERLATGKKTGPLLDTSLGSGSSDDSLYMQREGQKTKFMYMHVATEYSGLEV